MPPPLTLLEPKDPDNSLLPLSFFSLPLFQLYFNPPAGPVWGARFDHRKQSLEVGDQRGGVRSTGASVPAFFTNPVCPSWLRSRWGDKTKC